MIFDVPISPAVLTNTTAAACNVLHTKQDAPMPSKDFIFTYDTYEPGKSYGSDDFTVEPARVEQWIHNFPNEERVNPMPLGMIVLVQQQAFNRVITPRTRGNVQGEQTFDIRRLPAVGSTITTEVRCAQKYIRKERRWVQLDFLSRDAAGALLFQGLNTVLLPC